MKKKLLFFTLTALFLIFSVNQNTFAQNGEKVILENWAGLDSVDENGDFVYGEAELYTEEETETLVKFP